MIGDDGPEMLAYVGGKMDCGILGWAPRQSSLLFSLRKVSLRSAASRCSLVPRVLGAIHAGQDATSAP